jgi:hypothetical protein
LTPFPGGGTLIVPSREGSDAIDEYHDHIGVEEASDKTNPHNFVPPQPMSVARTREKSHSGRQRFSFIITTDVAGG